MQQDLQLSKDVAVETSRVGGVECVAAARTISLAEVERVLQERSKNEDNKFGCDAQALLIW